MGLAVSPHKQQLFSLCLPISVVTVMYQLIINESWRFNFPQLVKNRNVRALFCLKKKNNNNTF